ncbi:MAG: flavin reductase [Eubacterium sp.]|nr:flavin reductase [Eubacterium sp.]
MYGQEFKFFNLLDIFKNREKVEGTAECVEVYDYTDFNMRWIEPPIPIYYISTLDEFGNSNVAPISLGTCCWGEHPWGRHYYTIGVQHTRDTNRNLKLTKECVISYANARQLRESTIACCPVPYGISEMEVAKFTPLPSKIVKPAGIKECISNLEARVIDMVEVSNTTIFVVEIVGMSVDKEALDRDRHTKYQLGIGGTDLVFEMSLTGAPARMNYGVIDQSRIMPCPSTIGDENDWKGSFESWMLSELHRGRMTKKEYKKLLLLNKNWIRNSNPETNGEVKKELTELLREVIWRPIKENDYERKNDVQARKEHNYIRNAVGYYDATPELMEVSGKDAVKFLDRMLAGGVSKLQTTQAASMPMLNKDGIIIDNVIVFRPEEDKYWISTQKIDMMFIWFDMNRQDEDVSYREITADNTTYAVQGPDSRSVLNAILEKDITDQKLNTICDNAIDGHPVKIARCGSTGELGYELFCDPDDELLAETRLEERGKAYNIQRIMTDVITTSLPAEKGYVSMSDLDRLNPLEAGFETSIDWDKDFIGKDVLQKIKADGGAGKTLIGFTIDDPKAVLQHECPVLKGDKKIGRITRFTYGYTVEKVIGYCLVDIGAAKPGDTVTIYNYKAVLTDRVFYDPQDERIRG